MREPLCSGPLPVSRIIPTIDAHLIRREGGADGVNRSGKGFVLGLLGDGSVERNLWLRYE